MIWEWVWLIIKNIFNLSLVQNGQQRKDPGREESDREDYDIRPRYERRIADAASAEKQAGRRVDGRKPVRY